MITYSTVLRLRNEKVDDRSLEEIPHHKNDIRLPGNLFKRDRPCELVDETSGANSKVRKCHPLRAHLKTQHLNRIQRLQRREPKTIHKAKDINHRQRGCAAGLRTLRGRDTVVVGAAGGGEGGGCGGDADPDAGAAEVGE